MLTHLLSFSGTELSFSTMKFATLLDISAHFRVKLIDFRYMRYVYIAMPLDSKIPFFYGCSVIAKRQSEARNQTKTCSWVNYNI